VQAPPRTLELSRPFFRRASSFPPSPTTCFALLDDRIPRLPSVFCRYLRLFPCVARSPFRSPFPASAGIPRTSFSTSPPLQNLISFGLAPGRLPFSSRCRVPSWPYSLPDPPQVRGFLVRYASSAWIVTLLMGRVPLRFWRALLTPHLFLPFILPLLENLRPTKEIKKEGVPP